MDSSQPPENRSSPPEPLDDRSRSARPGARPGGSFGAEAWFSIAVGLLVLLMENRLILFLAGRDPGPVNDLQRGMIRYTQSYFFLWDLGLTAFGAALLLDGILVFVNRTWAAWLALAVMTVACALNLYAFAATYGPMGPQWLPAIAFIAGVYVAIFQWKRVRALGSGEPAPMT